MVENRRVGASGEVDSNRAVGALAFIVLAQSGPQFPGFGTDDRVNPGVKGDAAPEYLYAEDILFSANRPGPPFFVLQQNAETAVTVRSRETDCWTGSFEALHERLQGWVHPPSRRIFTRFPSVFPGWVHGKR